MSRGKAIMFIDNSNIFHGSKAAGWRIDAKKLHAFLEERVDAAVIECGIGGDLL